MNKSDIQGIHGFVVVLCMFFSVFCMSYICAMRSCSLNDGMKTTFTVRLKSWISIFLFLRIFKREITVWMVILQLINYASLVVAIFVYEILGMSSKNIDASFVRVVGVSFFAMLGLFFVDFFITSIRNKEY